MSKQKPDEDIEWVYESVVTYIKASVFRTPIKQFIDENCLFYDEGEENSFEHTTIHNKFKKLIETLLDGLLVDLGITQEQFIKSAKFGLDSENKKYFEQIIACDNYIYFKSLMVKRNLQLQQESYKMMVGKKLVEKIGDSKVAVNSNNFTKLLGKDKDYTELLKKQEQAELENALKLSLALEQEKKKLLIIEDEELKLALAVSKSLANEEEEISLFDASTLVKKGKENVTANPQKTSNQPLKINPNNTLLNKLVDQRNNPVVTSVKKDFDFSHLINQREVTKKDENINNNLIEVNEKITFDDKIKGTNISITTKDLIVLDDQFQSKVVQKDTFEEVQPEVINSIPVMKKDNIDNHILNTVNERTLLQNTNTPQQIDNTLDNLFDYKKNSQNEVSPKIINSIPVIKKDNINTLIPCNSGPDMKILDSQKTGLQNNICLNNLYDYKHSSEKTVLGRGGDSIASNNKMSESLLIPKNSKNFFESDSKKPSLLDFTINNKETVAKVNLGDIRKKNHSKISDSTAFLDQQFNYKAADKNELTKSEIPQEASNEDINKLYEDLQKEKAEKLKEYRSMVVQMKKDKRETKINEEEKKEEKNVIDDKLLSDETKKRLEMRKTLADRLSGLNKK